MNKTYRNIWNATTRTWTAVAETAKSHSKGSSRAARQAIVALALGGASIGGAFAADACTTEDGANGTLDTAGLCQASSMIGTNSIGTMAALDDALIKVTGATNATVGGTAGTLAIGNGANASPSSGLAATAVGNQATASNSGTVALGNQSTASGNGAVSIGSASTASGAGGIAIGTRAKAAGPSATSIGLDSTVLATATSSVALGNGSIADRDYSVSVGSAAQQRQITNLAAGTQNTDAVNLGQMNDRLATKVDNALVKVGTGADAVATGRAANIAIGAGASSTGTAGNSATIAIGEAATASGVAGAIAFGSTTQATGQSAIAMGLRANAASNNSIVVGADAGVGANAAGALALGYRSSVSGNTTGTTPTTANNSVAIGPNAVVASTATNNADNGVALGSGTRVSANGAVALGYNSVADTANTVSIGNSTTQRKIVNMAAGDVSAASTDAVNGSQLHGVADSVASAIGGGAIVNADGSISAPAFTVGDGSGGTKIVNSVGAAVTNLDGRTTSNEGNIKKLADEIGSGNVGLVQQLAPGADLTVGANNDGAAVNFAGTAGDRKLMGVANGTADSDAVNFGQLSATNAAVDATNAELSSTNVSLASTNAELSSTNVSLASTNAELSTTNVSLASTQTELSSAQTTIATHTTQIDTINNQLNELSDGTIGLVQQSAAGADLTVGTNTDGAAVNFAGTAGDRKLTGVASGTADSDAVNFGQLSATNAAVDATNAELSTTNVSLASTNTALSTTNAHVAALDSDMTTAKGNIATHTTDIATINDQLAGLSDGTVGLVQQSAAGADLTVGANTDGAAVNFAGTAGDRKLAGVAAGTADSDAVNFGQLSATNAAVDATNAELSTTNVSLASTQTELSSAQTTIATHTTQIDTINNQLNELSDGTIGLVQQSAAGADLTVGANNDGAAVNFAGTAGDRKLTGVANGTADSDAVNFGQLSATNAAVDATKAELSSTNVSLASTNAELSTTNVSLASTNAALSTAQTTIATHTTQIDTINDQLNELSDGTIGLVQQSAAGADLTVGANTDGAAVNFAGTAGDRKLTGVAAGTADSDAVNFGQLSATNAAVDATKAELSSTNVSLASTNAELSTTNVSLASTQTELSTAQTTIATHTTQIDTINDQLNELSDGTIGLVQQSAAGADLTVGANTDGAAVNFAGTAGNRKLTGIAAGDVSAASTEAVNGSQLHGVADSVASAIGGGSIVNSDGSISAPSFTVGDGSGGTKIVSTVGDVVTNLNDRVTSNEGGIKGLAEQLSSGTVGLVQQDATSGMITVGAGGAGSVVNFAGSGGPRVLTGVANGVHDDDVVTVSQLRATGLIDYTGKEVGAVTYDSGLSFDSVTFAGTDGTVLRQVAAGMISATSMEAVNGSQLYAMQEQFAKQYGELSGKVDDLTGRVGELETSPGPSDPGTGGPGAGGPGTGDGSTVVGEGADASGKNSSAIGNGSVASGENSSAIGQGSVASGKDSTAVGQGSVASGDGSTAIGQGASATGSNSVAIGQGSVATEANTVSFGDGTAEGNRRLVNIADGINASDAATKGQLDRAMESVDQRFNDTNRAINDVAKNAYAGIAAAMAMPNMTPSQPGKTVVAVGAANFKSGSAIAAGATYRSRNGNWLVNGATSVTSVGDVGVRAQVGYEF